MQSKTDRLSYLLRCFNAVSALLREASQQRFQTPAQVAQVARWKRVRRALAHDIEGQMAIIGKGVQTFYPLADDENERAERWTQQQRRLWWRYSDTDPLNEGVEESPTLSVRGL
jgi:hypothetical protein